jgi:uncharacterized protein YpmB
MKIIKNLIIAILIGMSSACNQMLVKNDVPAYVINPTNESRAELKKAVSKALNGIPVTLADDALTSDDRLIIERKRHVDAQGNVIMGLETEMPHQFRLVKNNGKCILINQANGNRMELSRTVCNTLK